MVVVPLTPVAHAWLLVAVFRRRLAVLLGGEGDGYAGLTNHSHTSSAPGYPSQHGQVAAASEHMKTDTKV